MMTWNDLYQLMCECLDLQIFQHGGKRVTGILLGPEEAAVYRHAASQHASAKTLANLYTGKLQPFMDYPVAKMRCPGVAVRIKPKITGILLIDEVGYWSSPPPKP